jgi:deoxyribose-phosphate aldolase
MTIASYIEHSLLSPVATIAGIEKLCAEAGENGFAAVCVPPLLVKTARAIISPGKLQLATVISFPLGYSVIEAKVAEGIMAILDGADEINMAINITALKNQDWQYLAKELNTIMPIVKGKNRAFNVIIETGLCTNEELITCCDIYGAAGVNAVITGTGYAGPATTIDTVQLLHKHLPSLVKITAGGGIKNYSFALQLINAGANRLSCSNGLQIIQEPEQQN